jgi:tetratricopeptide (TPR) repeat protein
VYRFAHALVRETLAGDLAPIYRARLHERVALELLEAYGEDPEHSGEIAEHLWAAMPTADLDRTLRAQLCAADVAWAALAYEQAERLLARTSTLLRSLPPAQSPADVDLGVHIRLGSLRSARQGYTGAAREAFDRARELASGMDRRADLLPALWGLSATAVVRGDLATAGELTAAALAEALHLPAGHPLATGHQGVGIVAFYRGQLAAARRHFAAALAAWQESAAPPTALRGPPASAQPDVMAPSYDALAACLMGDLADARRQIGRALLAAEGMGEPYAMAFVHSFQARLAVLARDREGAQAAATRAIEIAEQHGFPLLARHAAVPLGWARAGLGEPRAGLAEIERGLTELNRSGQRILGPFHRGLQAEATLALGDPAAAITLLDEALGESIARGSGFEVPGLHYLRGLVLHELGHGDEARTAQLDARASAREQGARAPNFRALLG